MPTIELVEFTDARVRPEDLSDIVAANENILLRQDFPALPERYGTPEQAAASVDRVRDHMRRDLGGFAAYAMFLDDTPRGVMTAEQGELRRRGWLRPLRQTVAEGPMVAYWFDERRPEDQRHVGVAAARALARKLKDKSDMQGHAWTVVRTDNHRSIRVLEDPLNGFGGFEPVEDPQDWAVGDGVQIDRQLYVARYSMDQVREAV